MALPEYRPKETKKKRKENPPLPHTSPPPGPNKRTKERKQSANRTSNQEAARALGTAFHMHNISLVYGGGTVGLMGETARTLVALAGPESVHGIIPAPLVKYERGPNSAAGEITSGSLPSYET